MPRPALYAMLLSLGLLPASPAAALELDDCRVVVGPTLPSFPARCGVLDRPLDPDDPDGETIALRIAVVPALTLEPLPDPVVPIAGGPGQATTAFFAGSASAFETLRRDRDIVLVDQRGTGESAALACDVDDEILQGQQTQEQALAATRQCLAELEYDPRFFTTSVAVRDLEAVRAALGYTDFNLYGISYGTRVAQHYARRYPDTTRTVILDGVVPPQMALGPAIALEAQRAVDGIFDRCAEQPDCNAAFPELAARFDLLVDQLRAEPVSVILPHPVTGQSTELLFGEGEFAGAIRLLAYHPTTIALIPLLVHEAGAGNYAPLAAQFINIRDNFAESLSGGMHNAVVCTEDVPFFSGEAVTAADLSATYLGTVLVDAIDTACSIWPAGVLDEDLREPLATDIPVLMLSGEVDPITPPAYALRAAEQMTNVLPLVGTLQGHGLAPRGCTPDIMAEFVNEGSVANLDTDCLDRVHAMPFFLTLGGPAP